ncbi:ATP-binding protein [Compostibacter hankyongensis]|uniref:ATP-binding protein n=1 Tax=Compostibacter hankyongensis TaxID=1007089 RepID=A0ABP8FCH7_9BACT
MLKSIAISQILERIRFENPWWTSNSIDAFFQDMPRRAYFEQFSSLCTDLSVQRAVVLMGPRRIGKTVMLHHLIQTLLNQDVSPRRILFITVENPIYNNLGLELLFQYGREALGEKEKTTGWYVIFDEIQYLKDWDVHLKSLVESYRGVRFIASGSAAAALKYKSQESGAGRFTDFMLPPLTFYEFINMQKLGSLTQETKFPFGLYHATFYQAPDIVHFNKLFTDYINFGGYPEAIFSESVRNNPERFIRNDVVDKVLLRDLPGIYGISDVQELNSLFTTIAYNSANEFSIETLSIQSGTPKKVIKKYLEYLEAAFLIKIVRRVDQAGRRFQRDNFFKIYLTNPSLRSALFSPIQSSDDAMGALAETAIYAQWLHRSNFRPWYARWSKGEVDMVGISNKNLQPVWALEIKWTNRYVEKPKELKSLLKFCKENHLQEALVTTISVQETKVYDDVKLNFIPAAAYAYTVGANTLIAQNENG